MFQQEMMGWKGEVEKKEKASHLWGSLDRMALKVSVNNSVAINAWLFSRKTQDIISD